MIELLRLDNVILAVPDLARAVDWYRERVGLRPVVVREEVAVLHPADGGAGLCLRLGPDDPSHSTVWFEVDDARAVAAGLGLEAFRIATGWSVEMTDPWGNTVGFTDYRG